MTRKTVTKVVARSAGDANTPITSPAERATTIGKPFVLVTCEHGGNGVPVEYAPLFATPKAKQWLRSHRGYDAGALDAAEQFPADEKIVSTTTRLLVDLNRSLDNPELFSEFVPNVLARSAGDVQSSSIARGACDDVSPREQILRQHYHPYRQQVAGVIDEMLGSNAMVIHLSIHTFTPRFHGEWRPIDIGLLFDPSRTGEQRLAMRWKKTFQTRSPKLRIFANQPYAGVDDGLTTAMRQRFPDGNYLGIEVEINHRYFKHAPQRQANVVDLLVQTFAECRDSVHR